MKDQMESTMEIGLLGKGPRSEDAEPREFRGIRV